MSVKLFAPAAETARAGHCPSVCGGAGRSLAARLWCVVLAGSALVFGGMAQQAVAADPAPVVERTRPLARAADVLIQDGATQPGAQRRAAQIAEARQSAAPAGRAQVVARADQAGAGSRTAAAAASAPSAASASSAGASTGAAITAAADAAASGARSRHATTPRAANRASAGSTRRDRESASAAASQAAGRQQTATQPRRAGAGKPARVQRHWRPAGNGTKGGLRKITATDRAQGAVRLTRAERGVVRHIARKFRVNESSIEQYTSYARQAGRTYNVDPYLILAVMATESSFNPRAQSRVGAQGLMQVHTRVHKERFKPYGSTRAVWEPKVNILVGSSILSDYLKRYGGSERRALKAYVGAAHMSHDGGYGNKVLRRRDEFVSVSVAAGNGATSQASASQIRSGQGYIDL